MADAEPEVVGREEGFQVRWRGPYARGRHREWTTLMRGFDTAEEARPVAEQMVNAEGIADVEVVAARTVYTVEERYSRGD